MGNYLLLLCVYFTFFINISNGCTINGVTQWLEPQHFEMKDTHRGLIISQTTSNIEGISLINFADGMNRGPYLELALSNSVLTITAKDEFAQYEEYETLLSIRFTVTFNCVGGTTRPLTYVFNIIDTNNHAPEFRPSDSYEFSLALPVPPGFRVSGCDYMIVRDIDLTTSRIDFDLRDNMYFEIVYFGQIQPKEFGAYIRTKTLITSLPETLSFDIHATDVDATNDDPLTSTAVVKIVADNTFRLPDPLTFSSAYFEADYTENNNLILREEYITLREGYDDEVEFHLEGVYAQYFNLVDNNNRLSFQVRSPLPEDISESQIFLVVAAEREFTSGASATVIVHLPRARELSFEESSYRGSIENNQVTLENIVLKYGYTSDVNFLLSGDFSTYFTTNNTENLVTIDLRSNLPENIFLQKNALLLTLSASGVNALTATTNVLLDIIKDDHVTPIFEKAVYNGIYNATTGLSLEEIIFIQGYDDSVDVILDGDQANLFTLQREGPTITLSGTIPAEIWPKQILIMTLRATKPRTVGANTVIQITLPSARELSFEATSYRGSLENNKMSLVDIMLSLGYATDVSFHLSGEFSSYFTTNNTENLVMISLRSNLPENVLLENNVLLLTLSASGVNTLTATTNVLLDIIKDDHVTPIFEKAVYNGIYDATTGLSLEQIVFIQGYDNTVDVVLHGDQANFFTLNREGPTITLSGTIPDQIWSKQMLILTLRATKPRTVGANTVIQITLPSARYLNFEKSAYIGNLRNNTVTIEEIILSVGYSSDLEFKITGEHFEYFILTNADNILSISTNTSLSEEFIFDNNFIALTISASGLNAITTSTTIVLEVFRHDTMTPIFSQHIYQGIYMNSTYFDVEDISLIQGYDDTVSFRLDGDYAKYFNMDVAENNVIINLKSPIPEDLIFDEKFLLFKVLATKDLTVGATAIVSVQFPTEMTEPTIMSFSQSTYLGSLMDDKFEITENIILETGFRPDTKFNLYGDYAEYFSLTSSKNVITIVKIRPLPTDQLRDIGFIIFQIEAQRERAVTASTSLIIEIIRPDTVIFPIFEKSFYTGTLGIEDGLRFEEEIRLAVGFDSTVTFTLEEDDSQWFTLKHISPNNISLSLNNDGLPQDMGRSHLIFSVVAIKENNVTGRSAIVISLTESSTGPNVTFGKLLYHGVIRLGNVMHESIEISGFTGTNIKISGEYAELFEANLSSGVIVITSRPSGILPNVSHIALELEAGCARAVLLLNILEPDTPVLPTVTFSSSSYVLRVDLTHTGSIGQVQATSDNGEAIRYSLVIDEDHLRERLSIVNEGELRLSAPVSIGMYSFQVVATTIITQASATAPVHLSIEAATICDGDIVVPPLIILDRDEEEPHRNLVVLNQTGCEYTLTNIWPKEQSWLYVDEDGLHTTAIDREHESIAFMALSQIQVELILRCEGDASGRTKRSLRSNSTAEWLGPYEYGSNKWILTDTIQYNARRSLVNLIVNDINDNVPIFVGQENQPIVVGYPVPELEAIILPRALVELKATDADIGENAAIVYRSSDESLAVSPSTGFVHIRDSSNLQNNARFDVHATDQNGAGHTSNVEILVKLLERNRIAVLNIRNAFLEDEEQILSNISKTAGYEVKALRTVVISDLQTSRNMRASSDELAATLRLFVYGLIGREPVDIQQLIADINNDIVTVNVASIISLEDHLTDTEICILPERDNGLLAATIALSVLLFILIVAIAVWFFLTWRKNKNYEQFSDRNSTASRNISIEEPKAEIVPKPRLNIEELKRSERKLQDRLDAPVTDVLASSSTSNEKPIEAIINMATPDPQMPIIIQTIDKLKDNAEESEDDDEFGEKMKSRRKSVVTFNENVEKIIHVEDDPNDDTVDDYESFQF